MRCDICNAKLRKHRQLLCDTCAETIGRLIVIKARSGQGDYPPIELAQATEANTSRILPLASNTPQPASGEGAPRASAPPNPYWEGSAIAGMYEILSDGKWHSLEKLKNKFNVDIDKRLHSIRRRGEKEAAWNLEVLEGRVRLAPKE